MNEHLASLTPDDDAERELTVADDALAPARPPYGYAAIMAGLLALLLTHALLGHWSVWQMMHAPWQMITQLDPPLIILAGTYYLLMTYRPRLPLVPLAIMASILGALYGLPYQMVFASGVDGVLDLVGQVIFSGIIGLLLAHWLQIPRRPQQVLAICFLFTFVINNVRFLWRV